ncbi:MAG: recombinase family protein [Faecalimonas sp.]|nr:recombinase family protein [Faecalimonas sp.]
MQRHTPLGYQIQNGKAEIEPETAELVKEVFNAYLAGTSTYRIAKDFTQRGILNASHKPSWNHGSIGKILENQKYLGDEFYPPLIERSIFEQVQSRRIQRVKDLGRAARPNSFANQSVWSSLLVCGECGQPYRKYTEKGQPPKWRCKYYIYRNRVHCRNRFLSEEQLERAFIQAVNQVIETPSYLKPDFKELPQQESTAERKLTTQINRLLAEPSCDTQAVKQLAFQRATEQYRNIRIDDRAYQNEKIADVLSGVRIQTICDLTLLEETIGKIVVQKHTGLEFYLKNDRSITIPIKEET